MARRASQRRSGGSASARSGFTLIEVLMVVIIIAILDALLLPAISAAVRSARNAAVSAEVNSLAQALASFKSKYGDYPPSRVYLNESGIFPVSSNISVGTGDITLGYLAQRSLIALRKFFPRVVFSSTAGVPPPQVSNTFFYDFNGNGQNDGAYILQGHQCLVFFLGGVPIYDPGTQTYGTSGLGKDPTNPFTNIVANPNRQQPFYEFASSRLFADPNDTGNTNLGTVPSGVPGYYDSLGNNPPGTGGGNTLNFFVYFSAYGNGVYDPNDVNFPAEADVNGASPIALNFLYAGANDPMIAPNPYTTTFTTNNSDSGCTAGTLPSGTVTFVNSQTFQLFSPGLDGMYGVGGQYVASTQANSTASNALPKDPCSTNTLAAGGSTSDGAIRQREQDNLTNFKAGTLQ